MYFFGTTCTEEGHSPPINLPERANGHNPGQVSPPSSILSNYFCAINLNCVFLLFFDLASLHFQEILLSNFYTYPPTVSSTHMPTSCGISLSWRYQVLCRLDLWISKKGYHRFLPITPLLSLVLNMVPSTSIL